MHQIVIETITEPPQELAVAVVKDSKRRRNRAVQPGMKSLLRWVVARDENGQPIGALSVGGVLGVAEIGLLWVANTAQRTGIGSRLLQAAEVAARDEGMAHMLVRAYDFESPGFFLRQGYHQLAALPAGPQAAAIIWLTKPLITTPDAAAEAPPPAGTATSDSADPAQAETDEPGEADDEESAEPMLASPPGPAPAATATAATPAPAVAPAAKLTGKAARRRRRR